MDHVVVALKASDCVVGLVLVVEVVLVVGLVVEVVLVVGQVGVRSGEGQDGGTGRSGAPPQGRSLAVPDRHVHAVR